MMEVLFAFLVRNVVMLCLLCDCRSDSSGLECPDCRDTYDEKLKMRVCVRFSNLRTDFHVLFFLSVCPLVHTYFAASIFRLVGPKPLCAPESFSLRSALQRQDCQLF